jgi:hypothetical protein
VALVVQDAEAYQRLLDIAAHVDAEEGIGLGEREKRKGPAREGFFSEIEANLPKTFSQIPECRDT